MEGKALIHTTQPAMAGGPKTQQLSLKQDQIVQIIDSQEKDFQINKAKVFEENPKNEISNHEMQHFNKPINKC